jgi:predicted nucleotidyltransferase
MAQVNIPTNFIENVLPVSPAAWYLGGSRARGEHRPDSDWDIFALYTKDTDIPYDWLEANMDDDGFLPGHVDFHYFAADWDVFVHNPSLLRDFYHNLSG